MITLLQSRSHNFFELLLHSDFVKRRSTTEEEYPRLKGMAGRQIMIEKKNKQCELLNNSIKKKKKK